MRLHRGEAPVYFAIGDIHGNDKLLEALYERILAAARNLGSRDKCLVHLGDYIDRGPNSRGVIARVRQGLAGFRTVCLRGNHEQLMLDAVRERTQSAIGQWVINGGAQTLLSYGYVHGSPAAAIDDLVITAAHDITWLEELPLTHYAGRYLFVHAGIVPGRALERQQAKDLLWIRDAFLRDRRDHGFVVVHGHTPIETGLPELRANRINLDTGAAYGGPLTAVMLDPASDEPPQFLQVKPR
ncbi:MAG: serine/threonine protein phosphatase [Alphaproteobacteria bacterium]|nr:serine/threonine protein phosphatase [Alphaproteobacteria bacterium]